MPGAGGVGPGPKRLRSWPGGCARVTGAGGGGVEPAAAACGAGAFGVRANLGFSAGGAMTGAADGVPGTIVPRASGFAPGVPRAGAVGAGAAASPRCVGCAAGAAGAAWRLIARPWFARTKSFRDGSMVVGCCDTGCWRITSGVTWTTDCWTARREEKASRCTTVVCVRTKSRCWSA
jgi:hypothetical protein